MDGAVAQRFVALPGSSTLGIYDSSNVQIGYIEGRWQFPTDGVLVKTISLEMETGNPDSLRHLETQILHFDVDTWRGYSYIWNDEQTDAVLAEKGSDRTFTIVDPAAAGGQRQQTWHFASRTECILCHTTRGGSIYGFNPAQLNKLHDYAGVTDNQLRTLRHLKLFDQLSESPRDRMVDPHDEQADLEERARAYLHLNCAHCHRRGGGGTAAIDVQYQLPLTKTNLLDSRPTQGTFGIHGAQVFAAGDPYRSVLFYRMSKLGRGRMPYIGSNVIDVRGLKLIHDWIEQTAVESTASSDSTPSGARLAQRKALQLLSAQPADADQQSGLLTQLLSTTSGSLMLLTAINEGTLGPGTTEQAIEAGTVHEDIQVRDLFERFLPEEKRPQRLGQVIDPQVILQLTGDAVRGEQLFATAAGVQCRNCHRLGNVGKQLGPDLTRPEKKRTRAQLLESILQPSKDIDPRYVAQLVETKDGPRAGRPISQEGRPAGRAAGHSRKRDHHCRSGRRVHGASTKVADAGVVSPGPDRSASRRSAGAAASASGVAGTLRVPSAARTAAVHSAARSQTRRLPATCLIHCLAVRPLLFKTLQTARPSSTPSRGR